MCPPAGLGAVIAYAKVHEDGALEEFYDFRTDWVWDPDRLETFTAEPAIYLFTNYLWSHKECIQVSEQIKALSPDSITIHGGPDTPKYEGEFSSDEVRHFLEALAIEARMALHATVLAGKNDHHRSEAAFKALARSLRAAVAYDERSGGAVPSTKGVIG